MPSLLHRGRRVHLILGLALITAACQSLPGLPAPSVDGTGWRSTVVAGLAPVAGSEPTVFFEAGRIAGSTGCNGFGGDIAIDGTSVKLGEVAMTLVGCDGPIGDTESRFMKALSAADRIGLRADGLLVLSGPEGDLVFRPDPGVGP